MLSVRAAALRAGTVGGTLFAVHISIPNCGNYPFIWPALTGAVAFWIATDPIAPHQFRRGMSAVLAAGSLAGLIMVVGSNLAILIFARRMLDSLTSAPTDATRLLITGPTELALAILGAIGVVLALVGGAAMMLAWPLRSSRAKMPATARD
jgi:hypothetical protein